MSAPAAPEGYFCLVLHAHLPFVRHPEKELFLEENWLFEAITETYLPLLQLLQRWRNENIRAPISLTLTPTLCAMLRDPLLQQRYGRYLDTLLELAEREVHRTIWEPRFNELAVYYQQRLGAAAAFYRGLGGNLVQQFRQLQDAGCIEILTSAATHAVLPLLASHPPSLRAQVLIARDDYRDCFGRNPRGIWLPECAYAPEIEPVLKEAGLHWFITDTHGILNARPEAIFGTFAPVITSHGLAAFGRDMASAKQVWSRDEGYPGDFRYRDFYRDIGFDLDLDYLRPFLSSETRSFTGLKYYAITGKAAPTKDIYSPQAAFRAADDHASHFLAARIDQVRNAYRLLRRPPVVVAPYDAELFGHWWYEGPQFLDLFVRKTFYDQTSFALLTPSQYLDRHPDQQLAHPAASSWGEAGYWRMWLDWPNAWAQSHLVIAQERMTDLTRRFADAENPSPLQLRALKQAGRELLLAQASDWPFIQRTGTSPEYARGRIERHLVCFNQLFNQLSGGTIDANALLQMELTDNLFEHINCCYWRG